jgi:hypothetical protein
VAYRKAGYIKPFHIRRTPYKCRMYLLGSYIVKEYSGARQKVRPPPARRRWWRRLGGGGGAGGCGACACA